MAPLQSRKRKSSEMDDAVAGPSDTKTYEEDDVAATPTGTPAKKKMRLTQGQKQALIDNLQLEITERARKLRSHYALQAQDLQCVV